MDVVQPLKHSWQWLIVPSLEKLQQTAVKQVFLTKSYCFILSYSCVDFKHMKLILLWEGREVLFSQAGEELNCHSMLLAESKTGLCKSASHQELVTLLTSLTMLERGKTVHLGSIYLHYFAQGPSLSPPSLTHIPQTNAAMTACRWPTWAHWHTNTQNTYQQEDTHMHITINTTPRKNYSDLNMCKMWNILKVNLSVVHAKSFSSYQ